MAENAAFQEFYLREIGVQIPIAQLSASTKSASTKAVDTVKESRSVASVSDPVPKLAPPSETIAAAAPLATRCGLEELAIEASTCTACQLAKQRNRVVFGVGNPQADIVFVGEAPGREEDAMGEPFVGRAGQLLDRMLDSVGMDRTQVYIMNTVKCRPPNNRDPKPEEVQACGKWFDAQLKMLNPKLIGLLGRVAAQTVLETDAPLSKMRGRWHTYHGIPTLVMFHPAYLLRSPAQKRHAWQHLLELKERYRAELS